MCTWGESGLVDRTHECRESKMGVLRRRAPQVYMSTGRTGPVRREKETMRVDVEMCVCEREESVRVCSRQSKRGGSSEPKQGCSQERRTPLPGRCLLQAHARTLNRDM